MLETALKHKRCWICKSFIMKFLFLTQNGYECEDCNKNLEYSDPSNLTLEAKLFQLRISKLDKTL